MADSRNTNPMTSFRLIADSSREDWDIIMREQGKMAAGLADRILDHFALLDGDFAGYPVDRYQHSLQTAMLAAEDGRDDEYIVCALLHDIGDTLGIYNHADVAAVILEPFVSEANHWMVKHHGIFQGYNFFHYLGMDRNMRDQFKESPYYEQTDEFVQKYDNPAFDADRVTPTLAHFAPLVQDLMQQPRSGLMARAAMEASLQNSDGSG
jgi:predicted HD phosphohydrolase